MAANAVLSDRRTKEPELSKLELRMAAMVGFCLPLLSFSRSYQGGNVVWYERLAPVDAVLLLALSYWVVTRGFRIPPGAIWYVTAIILSVWISLGFGGRLDLPSELLLQRALVSGASLILALCFLLFGYQIAGYPAAVRAIIIGVACAAIVQGIIAVHDFWSASPWFVDRMTGRVRGTFRASGQLGGFGFIALGLILTLGWPFWKRNRGLQLLCLFGTVLAAFCIIAASRRSGMLALAIWVGIFLFMGARTVNSRPYKIAAIATSVALILFLLFHSQIAEWRTWQRLVAAVDNLSGGRGFAAYQARQVAETFDLWFPFGLGAGLATPLYGHELHNTHLALLAEWGLATFVAYYVMIAVAVKNCIRNWPQFNLPYRMVTVAFFVAAMAIMIHNTFHRDRAFMLLLGLLMGVFTSIGWRDFWRARTGIETSHSAERQGYSPTILGSAEVIREQ